MQHRLHSDLELSKGLSLGKRPPSGGSEGFNTLLFTLWSRNQQHSPWRHIRNAEYQVLLSTENLCFNKAPRGDSYMCASLGSIGRGEGRAGIVLIMEFPYTLAEPWETSMLLGGDLTLKIMQ